MADPHKELAGEVNPSPTASTSKTGHRAIAQMPVYSFSPSASPEFQARVDAFTNVATNHLVDALGTEALGGATAKPFSSEREGETLHIVYPLTVNRGDLLGELLTLLAARVPTAVLHEGTVGWQEPEWSALATRHLLGIVSAVTGDPPRSFASTSSPVDLTRTTLWINATHQALSVPGGVRDAQGSPLPQEIGGAKSAAKYLTKAFAALRSCVPTEGEQEALKTLERLLKLWQKSKHTEALGILRKQKISWGTVLMAGSPTETKKIKGKEVRVITAPSKPSKSPWLSGKERTAISSILANAWSEPEEKRKVWVGLSPEQQHAQYNDFVKALKSHYEEINKMSSSIHSKLGHRKKWIYSAVNEAGSAPKSKKDKANQFAWTTAFFKLKTSDVKLPVALVFAPSHYLTDSQYKTQDTLDKLFSQVPCDITPSMFLENTPVLELWKEWATRFAPKLTVKRTEVPQAESLKDDNPFALLLTGADAPVR